MEINAGDRFAFGENWASFLAMVDERRIDEAVDSLKTMLGIDRLDGMRFVDIGSGSGLFSLAARRLGAEVLSFDYDRSSVACTAELRRRYHLEDPLWTVKEGSVLDPDFMSSLSTFDIVYSWGVLHHTGDMWTALGNVLPLVRHEGRLFISLYNDQGRASQIWTAIKRRYNASGRAGRWVLLNAIELWFRAREMGPARRVYRRLRRLPAPVRPPRGRGMDRRHDMIDWVGGYPFEVSKPEEVFNFCRDSGFTLEALKTCGGGLGCNEYVFSRNAGPATQPGTP